MSAHNLLDQERAAYANELICTVTATLTIKQVLEHKIITANSASAVALTLPTAAASMAGVVIYIAARGAGALTVIATGGYAAKTSTTTATFAQGDMGVVMCDGTNWYQCSTITAT